MGKKNASFIKINISLKTLSGALLHETGISMDLFGPLTCPKNVFTASHSTGFASMFQNPEKFANEQTDNNTMTTIRLYE